MKVKHDKDSKTVEINSKKYNEMFFDNLAEYIEKGTIFRMVEGSEEDRVHIEIVTLSTLKGIENLKKALIKEQKSLDRYFDKQEKLTGEILGKNLRRLAKKDIFDIID